MDRHSRVSPARTVQSLRYLIVEDHDFQRAMLEQALRALGAAQVRCASNGKEALRMLRDRSFPVDVVISDLMMPELDGIELSQQVQQAAPGVSLILYSADKATLDMAVLIAEGHGVRVLGGVEKPVTADKLRPVLQKYLARKGGASADVDGD
jgi:CheY-like chemotaxis protein